MKIKIKKTLDFYNKRVLQLYCKIKKGDEKYGIRLSIKQFIKHL